MLVIQALPNVPNVPHKEERFTTVEIFNGKSTMPSFQTRAFRVRGRRACWISYEKLTIAWHLFYLPDEPVLHLALGPALDPAAIKEGDDVYFECTVNANPPARHITWLHNVRGGEIVIRRGAVVKLIAFPPSSFSIKCVLLVSQKSIPSSSRF